MKMHNNGVRRDWRMRAMFVVPRQGNREKTDSPGTAARPPVTLLAALGGEEIFRGFSWLHHRSDRVTSWLRKSKFHILPPLRGIIHICKHRPRLCRRQVSGIRKFTGWNSKYRRKTSFYVQRFARWNKKKITQNLPNRYTGCMNLERIFQQ